MKKAYISGALTNVSNSEAVKSFYESIGEVCKKCQLIPYVPHLYTDPDKNPTLTPIEVFQTDKTNVSAADILIAYIGINSLGVGMELAYAEMAQIPIFLLYEKGKNVSRFPRGIPSIVEEIVFQNYSEGIHMLEIALNQRLPFLTKELHIELLSRPNDGYSKVTIRDGNNYIFCSEPLNSDDEDALVDILYNLKRNGLRPTSIYVDLFSKFLSQIKLVWDEADILSEYQT